MSGEIRYVARTRRDAPIEPPLMPCWRQSAGRMPSASRAAERHVDRATHLNRLLVACGGWPPSSRPAPRPLGWRRRSTWSSRKSDAAPGPIRRRNLDCPVHIGRRGPGAPGRGADYVDVVGGHDGPAGQPDRRGEPSGGNVRLASRTERRRRRDRSDQGVLVRDERQAERDHHSLRHRKSVPDLRAGYLSSGLVPGDRRTPPTA